jgi:hypothetical protein
LINCQPFNTKHKYKNCNGAVRLCPRASARLQEALRDTAHAQAHAFKRRCATLPTRKPTPSCGAARHCPRASARLQSALRDTAHAQAHAFKRRCATLPTRKRTPSSGAARHCSRLIKPTLALNRHDCCFHISRKLNFISLFMQLVFSLLCMQVFVDIEYMCVSVFVALHSKTCSLCTTMF